MIVKYWKLKDYSNNSSNCSAKFNSLIDMFEFLVRRYYLFDLDEIYISYQCSDLFRVSVIRLGNHIFDSPITIGYCEVSK